MNEAQRLLASIGVAIDHTAKQAHGNKLPSYTKAGPGRYHQFKSKAEVAAARK